jgi:hypothetical protein
VKWAMHVISSNVWLSIVRSKCKIWNDLIAFAVNDFCTILCIFDNAHVSHLIVFDFSSFFTVIFLFRTFNFSITVEWQCFNLRCHTQSVAFVVVLDWTKFVVIISFSCSKINKLWRIWMSQIFFFDFIFIRILILKHLSNSCLISLMLNTNVTSMNDMYAVSSNNNFLFCSFNFAFINIVSYFSISMKSSDVFIHSHAKRISSIKRFLSYVRWSLHSES